MRKIYYNNLLARLLLWRKDYETAMIFGFICTKRKQAQPLSSKAVNHEAIHVEQYMEVTSEVMAILAIAKDLKDLRQRMGKIIVAYDRDGKPVTTADLEVDGAMTAWMVEAINPNLIQTIEGQPVFVHAGPFANIAIGQSSVSGVMLPSSSARSSSIVRSSTA